MTIKEARHPFYAKASILLIGLCALIAILYVLQSVVVPLIFAVLIAIVLNPLVSFFVRIKINRIVAIVFSIIIAFLLIAAVSILLISQISQFSDSLPALANKISQLLNQITAWASSRFKIEPQNIQTWIADSKEKMLQNSSAVIGVTLMSVGSVIIVIILVPVYVFLLLYYKALILQFIYSVVGPKHRHEVSEITGQTQTIIQHYLIGLLIEIAILSVLQSIGLLILGIDFAIMLGILGALINIIPYIGGIVAVALPMIVALATKSPVYALYVMAIYYFIQLIDNNYIVPKIVASKVKINALFSIVIVLLGNALWGIPGMFLSLPLLAIIKLVFDHIEPLKPWGVLFGDTIPDDNLTI